ncbi:DUF4352 domain-containing protein [Rhodococcus sp. NPDC127528]|uniref:DUF4352 domain-containing protein n=1 Tax=unclassified Rhodococcus (in: high G+C Gram-positive bacteria) TaxID=192944 RepID=UPI00362B8FCD
MAGVLMLAGCGSNDTSSDSAIADVSTTSRAVATTTAAPTLATVGQQVRNGGLAITVNSVTAAHDISYTKETYRNVYETKTARNGGQFIIVSTKVENVGSKSLDLTCGYAVANLLADESKRQFDTIDSLYRVEGNPECNDNLQPGFSADMKYVYEIPSSARPMFFGFYDPSTQSAKQVKFIDTGSVPPPA